MEFTQFQTHCEVESKMPNGEWSKKLLRGAVLGAFKDLMRRHAEDSLDRVWLEVL